MPCLGGAIPVSVDRSRRNVRGMTRLLYTAAAVLAALLGFALWVEMAAIDESMRRIDDDTAWT